MRNDGTLVRGKGKEEGIRRSDGHHSRTLAMFLLEAPDI